MAATTLVLLTSCAWLVPVHGFGGEKVLIVGKRRTMMKRDIKQPVSKVFVFMSCTTELAM